MEPRSVRVEATGYQPLVVLVAAVAGGIVLDALLDPGYSCWLLLAIGSLILGWRARRRGCARISMALLLASVVGLGGTWHHVAWRRFPADDLGRRLDATPRPVCLEVDVESEPRRMPAPTRHPLANYPSRDETECVVRIRALRRGLQWRACDGRARLTVPGMTLDAHCGDRLRVLATASRPAPPGNPGEYDVAAAERGQRRLVRLNARSEDAVQVVRACRSWSWRRWLSDLREAGQQCLRRNVSAKQAALASALLLGTREQLDPDLNQTFFVTGLAHLLAISGLNVAIFAYGFWAVVRLGWLPRRLALVWVALLAVFYALLTGAEPPVVRASILVVCVCGARLLARQGLAYNTLAAAGLVVLAVNPTALFQTGTQLSFLAVAVLCREAAARPPRAAEDPLDALIDRSRPWWERLLRRVVAWSWQAFATSGRVWLMSLPLVAWRFHLVSPVALLLNPLVLLPAAVALYAGFLTLVLGSVWPAAASWTGSLCGGSLEFIDTLLAWGRSIPGNHYWTPGPTLPWVLAFYGAAALAPFWGLPRRWSWALVIGAAAVILSPLPRGGGRWPDSAESGAPWSCTFVSVGHGTSVLVEFPDGRTLLYDCGRLGWPAQGTRAIASTLWSRGVSRLDAIVISHADTDHFNALPDLLDRFSVGTVYVSPQMFARPNPAVSALRDAIWSRGVVCRMLSAGDRLWPDGPGRLEVLHPPVETTNGSDNSASVVLSIERDGRRVLLPGDLEGPGMERLLAQDPRRCDIVMAPHHGSAQGNSPALLAWARPDWIIVSGSAGRASVVARHYDPGPARLLHTAREGAIRLELSRESVRGWTWKGRWEPCALSPPRMGVQGPGAEPRESSSIVIAVTSGDGPVVTGSQHRVPLSRPILPDSFQCDQSAGPFRGARFSDTVALPVAGRRPRRNGRPLVSSW